MVAESERDYPEETCGLLFSSDDALEVVPMENIQNQLHAKDPVAYPRDAKTAFQFDSLAFDKTLREKESFGVAFRAIYHSHPDHGSYFSEKDRADAAPPGWGPLYPDVVHIVFSIQKGKLADQKGFVWSGEQKDFVELTIERGN